MDQPRVPSLLPFQRVAIVGVGLLGASLGLALKRRSLAGHIVGIGRAASASLDIAVRRQAIDEATSDLAAGVRGCDLVVLCTPVRQIIEQLAAIAPALEHGALVTDVGSTKRTIVAAARQVMPRHATFIGSHPMAGSEQRGPEHARADLYDQGLCLICPEAADAPAATARLTALWQGVGMRTQIIDPEQHDRWVALVSHLPHAAATGLTITAQTDPAALQAAAGGFVDTTRIAGGDVAMWLDIFLTNGDQVAAVLAEYQQHLAALREALLAGDQKWLSAHLTQAKAARDAFMAARQKTRKPPQP